GGNYAFLGGPSMLAAFVERELTEAKRTVADRVVATLGIPAGWRVRRVFGGAGDVQGDRVVVPVGTLAEGASRRLVLVMEAVAVDSTWTGRNRADLRYRRVGEREERALELPPVSIRASDREEVVQSSRDLGLWGRVQALLLDETHAQAMDEWRAGRA